MKKIIFFSGSRAEFNIQSSVITKFQKNKQFKVSLIVSGSHTSSVVGNTFKQIKDLNIKVSHQIKINLNHKNNYELSLYSSKLQSAISKIFKKIEPDCIFLTSDRFETLAVALVAHFMKIPIIHLEGGDVTEGGTLDDKSRHAITKLSDFHLVTNYDSKKRVLKLGEEKKRVFDIGFPPLNEINKKKLFPKKYIEQKFKIKDNEKIILFTYHPVPSEIKNIKYIFNILNKVQNKNVKIIITYPNFDSGYKYIINEIENINKNKNIIIVKNLGQKLYFSLLNYMGFYNKGICMGNSSSGIKETLYFKCKTINIGSRQNARLKTKNIIDIKIKDKEIIYKINKLLLRQSNFKNLNNPYFSKMKIKNIDKKLLSFLNRKDIKKKSITY
jgi:UDP-hydrolysing UDP-N-acetyl-D-glucosamine 2-epimerase